MTEKTLTKPQVGVSSCLLGHAVRYDGTDKREMLIADQLSRYLDFIDFCPEVAIGLGVPRETIMLVGSLKAPNAIGTQTPGHDVTQALKSYAQQTTPELVQLCGYIVKTRSPSCGWQHVNIFKTPTDEPIARGRGLFIAEVHRKLPYLPIIDEEALKEPEKRLLFLESVFALFQWQQLTTAALSLSKLTEFHSRYKYSLMARSQIDYRDLGQFVASISTDELHSKSQRYLQLLMHSLNKAPTPQNHANVLQHLVGYFKKQLTPQEKQDLNQSIERYQNALCPLSQPINLLKALLSKYPNDYLSHQAYLFPYPDALNDIARC